METTFPSPMGIFFISIMFEFNVNRMKKVSVPYGDLFYFYDVELGQCPISKNGFRPLWGSFLFLSCPMETLPGMEKTCTLRCKKFSPVKSGDSKLVNCSVP